MIGSKYKLNRIHKKIFLFVFFVCVNICFSSCNKYAQEEKLLREEQGIKYYFVGEESDYSFKKASLTVHPNETIKKEIIGNKAELTITRKSEDEWTVSLDDTVMSYDYYSRTEDLFEETFRFSCIGDFKEASVVPGRLFDDPLSSYYYITEGFIPAKEMMEIVNNGERIGAELNEQSDKDSFRSCFLFDFNMVR